MLIVVPSSETKRAVPLEGPPLDVGALAFPALNPVRERLLEALEATSEAPDGVRRLRVSPRLMDEVARNTAIRVLPTRPVLDLYSGPLHEGLDWATVSDAGRRRADGDLVVVSALFGLLRPADRIPPYRMDICSRLVGVDGIERLWRTVVPVALAGAAGPDGLVVDLRSSSFRAMGMSATPAGRTVVLRAEGPASERPGDVLAKRVRGQVARRLLEDDDRPEDPVALAEVIGRRWPVRLDEPARRTAPWTLTVTIPLAGRGR